jgi:hypothetical protein
MQLRAPSRALALLIGIAISVFASGSSWSAPGTLLHHEKINDDSLAAHGFPLDNGDEFGDAVASLGDLDGPGPSVVALAVGAISDDDGGSHHGAVYILFLDGAGSIVRIQKISSTQGGFTGVLDGGDEFGGAIAYLGDLDGPGPSVGAIAVGTAPDDDGATDAGAVWILFLDSEGKVLSHQKISATQGNFSAPLEAGDEFGGAVGSLGDLDGAGPSACALAVGAVHDNDGGTARGAAYILYLSSSGTVLSYSKISDTQGGFNGGLGDNDNFGEDVAYLGDLDGAGPSVATLAVTAVDDDDGGNDRGAVYVLFLQSNGHVLSFSKISDTQGGFTGSLADDDNFGTAVTSLGDLDGSGPSVGAIAVGAGSDDGVGLDRGAVYIIFLNASGSCISYQEISSTSGNFDGILVDSDEFGSGLAALGDIDGAGPAAMTLVSAASYDAGGGALRGAVYLLSLAGEDQIAGVGDSPVGSRSGLSFARPNPFRQATRIAYRIAEAGRVHIDVLDVRGRRVRTLTEEQTPPGEHSVSWNGLDDAGRPLAPGTYFLRMSLNGRALTSGSKAVLLK